MSAKQWLSLGEVAELLGVHPSTVRNWADQGHLPVYRTRGGHRRFKQQDVELWAQSQRAGGPDEATILVRSALQRIRFRIDEGQLDAEGWYQKLDENARNRYRREGRALLQGLVTFLTTDEDAGKAEARSLGIEYASIGYRYGLDSTEAVAAFLFFRNALLDALVAVYESAAIHSPDAWGDMLRKINQFADDVLLALVERYEFYN